LKGKLHINISLVIFAARKSADDTLATLRILLERGCKELINAPDSLGNTPLHALIVRYALEEARYGYDKWSKWDVLHLVRFLLQNGAKQSINQAGNSAMACVFRHLRDWEVCYELLSMLIKENGETISYLPLILIFMDFFRGSQHRRERWICTHHGSASAIN